MTDQTIHLSNNIYLSSSPILYLCRIFGLAPFSIKIEGSQWKISLTPTMRIYSFILGITLVSLTIYGITNEIKLDDNAFRMKDNTSKYVTCADVLINELVVVAAVANIPFLYKKLFTFIKCISEVDTAIKITDSQHARTVSISSLSAIMLGTTCLLSFDLYVWYASAKSSNEEFLILNYLPYHLSYFVIILAECQFAHMGFCVKRRLKLINDDLTNISNPKNEITVIYSKLFINNYFSKQSKKHFELGSRKKVESFPLSEKYDKPQLVYPTDDHVSKTTKAYLVLCDAVDAINDLFGHIVLIILVSSLLHLTVTPFFFIVELTERANIPFIILQVLWFLAHFFQLILIVEPCNICLKEVKHMSGIVCRLLSSPEVNENYKKQLELLFSLLQYRGIEFSAFELGTIDRSLVTSVAGAVSIYLVTIIQFQNLGTTNTM